MTEYYEQPLPIRTYDIDFAGIVSNIVFIRWLEDLRLGLMDQAYPLVRRSPRTSRRSCCRRGSPTGGR